MSENTDLTKKENGDLTLHGQSTISQWKSTDSFMEIQLQSQESITPDLEDIKLRRVGKATMKRTMRLPRKVGKYIASRAKDFQKWSSFIS